MGRKRDVKVYLDEKTYNIVETLAREREWSFSKALRRIIIEWNEAKSHGEEDGAGEDSELDNFPE